MFLEFFFLLFLYLILWIRSLSYYHQLTRMSISILYESNDFPGQIHSMLSLIIYCKCDQSFCDFCWGAVWTACPPRPNSCLVVTVSRLIILVSTSISVSMDTASDLYSSSSWCRKPSTTVSMAISMERILWLIFLPSIFVFSRLA